MDIRSLAGKKICILGYGREGQAMAAALEKHAKGCRIMIADKNPELRIMNYELRSGDTYLDHLDGFDVIIKSPGIPPNSKLKAQSSKLATSTQIFLDSIEGSGATVIGVTGSKGKSTTASLIHHIFRTQSSKLKTQSFFIGNIGEPAISHLGDAGSNTFFVHEMSSYQLMDLTSSPQIAVVTTFFPEHLDYHGSLQKYLEAKKHITRFQREDDVVFFNADSEGAREISEESKGKKIPFRMNDAPVSLEEIQLKGKHNLGNIAAAFKVAVHLGIDREDAIAAIRTFKGLPHRLESLGVHDGMEWVNDSISTTPQSAIAALDALGDRVATIILGGQDRGYDFSPLIERLKTSSVKTVILLPDSGATIRKKLQEANVTMNVINAETMEEATKKAKEQTSHEPRATSHWPIVLLSPAAPSYGHFKNFEDRGSSSRSRSKAD